MAYALQEITPSFEAWDAAISPFKTKLLFHESVWLGYLEKTQQGRRLLLAIRDGEGLVGYFCGVVVHKGPFRLLGSPLRGWWTPGMGPVANEYDEKAFLAALDAYCRASSIDYLEMITANVSDAALAAAGYEREDDVTFEVRLGSPDQMWQRLKKEARHHIRQAEKYGIQVEIATDASVMKEYYDQLLAVFARQGLTPPHSREMMYALWDSLQPAGKLLVLQALHQGRCIATFVHTFDHRVIYSLGTASWPDAYRLRPNDLLQWKALTLAAERGLAVYDMCGGGSFKPKFGAEQVPRNRWHKAYSASARLARSAYKAYWYGRRELQRRWNLRRKESKADDEASAAGA